MDPLHPQHVWWLRLVRCIDNGRHKHCSKHSGIMFRKFYMCFYPNLLTQQFQCLQKLSNGAEKTLSEAPAHIYPRMGKIHRDTLPLHEHAEEAEFHAFKSHSQRISRKKNRWNQDTSVEFIWILYKWHQWTSLSSFTWLQTGHNWTPVTIGCRSYIHVRQFQPGGSGSAPIGLQNVKQKTCRDKTIRSWWNNGNKIDSQLSCEIWPLTSSDIWNWKSSIIEFPSVFVVLEHGSYLV